MGVGGVSSSRARVLAMLDWAFGATEMEAGTHRRRPYGRRWTCGCERGRGIEGQRFETRATAPVAPARLEASANQRLTRCGKILIGMHSVPARAGTGAPGGAGGQRRARRHGSGDGRHVHSIGTVDGRFRDPR